MSDREKSVLADVRERIEALPRCSASICQGGDTCEPKGHAAHVRFDTLKFPGRTDRNSILFIEDVRNLLAKMEAEKSQ